VKERENRELKRKHRELNRREFLRIAGGTAGGLAVLPWLEACSPLLVTESLEDTGLSLGCAVGDVTPRRAVVWLRAEKESAVSVHYAKDPGLNASASRGPVRTAEESDYTAKILLDELEPKTRYYYRAVVAGKKPGPVCHFVTAPLPEDPADIRFTFSGDSRDTYRPFLIMDSIREMRPDFFLHLGDTIYADRNGVARVLPQFWAKYVINRTDPPTQRLFSETSLYVIWDDHEVGDNYHPSDPLAPIGRRAFLDYWPVLQDPGDPYRIYRSVRWGRAVELFILDTRQYRDPSAGTILGERQKRWFLEALSSSDAWFKFVATSVPFTSPNSDKWGGYRKERDEILDMIQRKGIKGVVFLSADVHYAAVSGVGRGSGLKEIIVGPIGAPMGLARGTARRFEFFSRESFNYGMATVYAKANPPYAEIEILGANNKSLYKTRIEA